jgi:branched-subunit amino acid ABC-type transport system permease component
MNLTLKDVLLSGGGALIGSVVGGALTPHYEDIKPGQANRTAVYGSAVAMNTTLGAVAGAILGGLVAGLTTQTAPQIPPVTP